MKKIISVQVSDSILMQPDVVTIFSSVAYHDGDYKKCNEKGSAYLDNLLQIFKKYVKHEDISVGAKSVRERVKYVENRSDASNIIREAVKDGYDFYSSISVYIDGDSDNLESLIQILSDLGGVYNTTYNYSVSDTEQYREKLLKQMIKKAKARAKVIAEASDTELKCIASINYTSEPQSYYRGSDLCNSVSRHETYGVDYAKPQKLSDSIIVNFKIK